MFGRAILYLSIGGLAFAAELALGQIPAFPGADGAAANVTGGRGGIVYHVTKLNSAIDDSQRNDVGTLRYGLNNANFPSGVPRTIVFDVGGVFHLGRLPQPANNWDPNGNGWDAQSRLTIGGTNVTLAGQTAPGAGVIFMGGGLKPQGNNNIIRNVTVAAGYGLSGWWSPGNPFPSTPGTTSNPPGWFPDNVVYDAMDISGTNLMIDHVSTLYATDETISMNEVANNITVQYSNISQGQNYPQWDAEGGDLTGHALGSLLSAGSTTDKAAISFHHNLYAHLKGRIPQIGDGELGAYYDFRNNIFYNWFGTAGSKGGTTFLNLVNNFYLAGDGGDQPAGGTNPAIGTQAGGTGVISASSSVHRTGNLLDSVIDDDANDGQPLAAGTANALWKDGIPTYTGSTDTAVQAFDRVLKYMGANWWTRGGSIDTPDERIVNEARTGTGKIIAWADDPWNNNQAEGAEWRSLKNTPQANRAADWDTEVSVGYGVGDGMPTSWELAHGLDPNARDDTGDFDSDGYTNLEEYLNEVAEWPAPKPLVFNAATNNRYAQITNWDIRWQPSKYDEAQINSGTAVVDSVGQHAGTLKIAALAGNTAQLDITGGWLKAANSVVIGGSPTSTGTLNLSGGKLVTPQLSKSEVSTFNFTGGTLAADVVNFNLTNNGGTIAPGQSPGKTVVTGDLTLNSGILEIELSRDQLLLPKFDQVEVSGLTHLGGTLQLKLIDIGYGLYAPKFGDSFGFLKSQLGTDDKFDAFDLPALASGLGWAINQVNTTSSLDVVLIGDYNNDQVVDSADYVVWRNSLEAQIPLLNETASRGTIDTDDYNAWRANFGRTVDGAAGSGEATTSSTSLPEPEIFAPLCFVISLLSFGRIAGTNR